MAGNVNFDANNNVSSVATAIRNNGIAMGVGTVVGGVIGYALGNTIENKVGRYASHTLTTLNIIGGGALAAGMSKFNGEIGVFVGSIVSLSNTDEVPAPLRPALTNHFAYGLGMGAGAGMVFAGGAALIRMATKEGVTVEAENVTLVEVSDEDEI